MAVRIGRRIGVGLAWISVVVAGVAFCLPWAHVDLASPGLIQQLTDVTPLHDTIEGLARDLGRVAVTIRRGAEVVTGDLSQVLDIPRTISGAQIPRLVRQPNAQVAIALMELLTNTRQHLVERSAVVYLAPGIALWCGLLLTFVGRRRAVAIAVAGLCAGIAGMGGWKLLTTDTSTLVVAIAIGPGLWLSLGAYLGLAVAGAVLACHRQRAHVKSQ
jgi:hypothetical protein